MLRISHNPELPMDLISPETETVVMSYAELLRREQRRVERASAHLTPQARRSASLAARATRIQQSAPRRTPVAEVAAAAQPAGNAMAELAMAAVAVSLFMTLVMGVLVMA